MRTVAKKSRARGRGPAKKTRTTKIEFIESMECLGVTQLPEGPEWSYEIKLDGFRLEAVKERGEPILYSRRGNVLNRKFPSIVAALARLPKATVIDGEVVAVDSAGRSDFNLLQNFRSAEAQIHYYAFDILMLKGESSLHLPLSERRKLLGEVLPRSLHVTAGAVDHRPVKHILSFVTSHGLEGVVAKRSDSVYEPGRRSGLWSKHRVNQGQEFVVGGYTPGTHGFDALIVGFYRDSELLFAARVRAGFVPATRRAVFEKIKHLKVPRCPFVNLPEATPGRWGQGLTADKMKGCRWLKPDAVVRIDFAQWTGADKLRHTKFVAMRDDKDPRKVVKEDN